jgi:hypothetical protein
VKINRLFHLGNKGFFRQSHNYQQTLIIERKAIEHQCKKVAASLNFALQATISLDYEVFAMIKIKF